MSSQVQPEDAAQVDDQIRVLLPRDLVNQIRAYDHDLVWTIRRSLAALVFEEERQQEVLASRQRQRPGRPRRAA